MAFGKGRKERLVPVGEAALDVGPRLRRDEPRRRSSRGARARHALPHPPRPGDDAAGVLEAARPLRASRPASASGSRRTSCATRSPPTSSSAAPTCARCRRCWATPTSARPRSTPTSRAATCARSTTASTRAPDAAASHFGEKVAVSQLFEERGAGRRIRGGPGPGPGLAANGAQMRILFFRRRARRRPGQRMQLDAGLERCRRYRRSRGGHGGTGTGGTGTGGTGTGGTGTGGTGTGGTGTGGTGTGRTGAGTAAAGAGRASRPGRHDLHPRVRQRLHSWAGTLGAGHPDLRIDAGLPERSPPRRRSPQLRL